MGCDGEAAGDGRGGGGGRMKIQKQEPHTMMWGKTSRYGGIWDIPSSIDTKFAIEHGL